LKTLTTIVALAACTVTAPDVVPLEVERGSLGSGKLFATARFDGHPVRCLLDTGANASNVAGEAFAGYPAVGLSRSKGAGNVVATEPEVEVASATLGPLQRQRLRVARVAGQTGTIGMDISGQRPFTLQVGARPALIWNARQALDQAGLRQHRGEISVPVTLAGQPMRALWDTGAGLTCVDRTLPERLPGAFSFVQEVNGGKDSTGNAVAMKLYKVGDLQVGAEHFRDLSVLAIDFKVIQEHLSPDLQVLLGFNAIAEATWSFDPGRQRWAVHRP
jgi:hypothetical protein